MQSTHTIHTQSLGHRTQLGKGETEGREDLYLITVWMLAMNQKICFVPRFVRAAVRWTRTRPRTWGDGQTDSKECTTNRCCCCPFHIPFATPLLCHLFLSLSFVFVIQFICFVCSVEGRKKCKRKAAKICGRYWTQQISSRSWQAQEKWEASTCRYSVKELNYNLI